MGVTERRQRQKSEVRKAILATAWAMVQEEGWQSLSIRKIASAIEYSVPVIYDHFENKEAILFEFVKEGFRMLSQDLKEAAGKAATPQEQIRAMGDAYWHFAFRQKEHYQLMFSVGIAKCETESCLPEKAEFRNLLVQPIGSILSETNNEGKTCLKYHTLWSVMHGLISIKLMNASDVSDELNKMVLDDAITGFLKNLGS